MSSFDSWDGYGVRVVREAEHPLQYQNNNSAISTPADAYGVLSSQMAQADREMFVIVILNARHKVLGINTVSVGSVSASIVHPREVFKPAILMGASALILAHNHPSGVRL